MTSATPRLEVPNGVNQNALSTNGVNQNGVNQNGVNQNGLFQTVFYDNGAVHNGVFRNNVVLDGVLEDVVVYDGLWQDAIWQKNPAARGLLRNNTYTRQMLQYVYDCAMGPNQSTVLDPKTEANPDGVNLELRGGIGLWPAWGDPGGACGGSCQRWVSACVLARTNAYGVKVDISMRVPLDAPEHIRHALKLRPDEPNEPGELEEFPLPEGAYYGNIFRQVAQPEGAYVMAPSLHACAGPGSNVPQVTKRFLSSQGSGGPIKVVGTCQSRPDYPGACLALGDSDTVGAMSRCFTDVDSTKPRAEYKEVITVYLREPLEVCGNRVCEANEAAKETCPSDCHPGWAKRFKAVLASKSNGPGATSVESRDSVDSSDSRDSVDSVDSREAVEGSGAVGSRGAGVGRGAAVSTIVMGGHHSCAIVEGGQVRCWGNNDSGQLGDGTQTQRLTPVAVLESAGGPPLAGAQALALGAYHSCALLAEGKARCWGNNAQGQLGDGTQTQRLTPVAVLESAGGPPLAGAQALALGTYHSCALLAEGKARCWGYNAQGQLGDGTQAQRFTPVAVLESAGGPPLAGAQALALGAYHSCVRLAEGKARCWGYNAQGQLGDGTQAQRLTPVAVLESAGGPPLTGAQALALGNIHSCALLAGGEIRCWGNNDSGQLGDDTQTQRLTPVTVLESAGGPPLAGAQALALGSDHSCALLGDGVRCWGRGNEGQLGDGATGATVQRTPVAVLASAGGSPLVGAQALALGGYHSCALLAGGEVRCWGYNDSGQLGDATTIERLTPVPARFDSDGPYGDYVPPGDAPKAGDLPWATVSALGRGNTVVLAGITTSDVDLGGGPLPSLGTKHGVLATFDENGAYLKGTRFAVEGALYPASVAVAPSGTIVVAATTQGPEGAQGRKAWLGTFTEDGDELPGAGPIGSGTHTADKLAIDKDGNLLVAGTFYGSVTFGATTLTSAADGKPHAFVVKVTPEGASRWAVGFAPDARGVPVALAVDGGGNVLLSLEAADSSTGLWKLSASSGSVLWRQWGWHDGVVAGADGDVYATGSLSGAYDFDVPDAAGGGDFFVARYAGATGAPLYWRVITPSCRAATTPCQGWFVGHTIALDQTGDVIVGVLGGNQNVINFGTGAFRMDATPDVYVAAFSPQLETRWSKHVPLILDGNLLGMQIGDDGRVMMSGSFAGSMLVDDRLLTTHIPEQSGVENTFLAVFGIPSPADVTAPIIDQPRMPEPIWLEATSAEGASVFYVLPPATDEGNFGVSLDCFPPPDSIFPLGPTPVKCVATDPLGNKSSQTFEVTVVDQLGPAFSKTPAIGPIEATGHDGAAVSFGLPRAVDMVDGDRPVTCDRASGSTFRLGPTVVTCWAEDLPKGPQGKTNRAETVFGVTVVDTAPPAFPNAPADIVVEATSAAGATVTFALPSAVDVADASPQVTCDPASGSLFELGQTTVTCTASDSSGNLAQVAFAVTVVAPPPPPPPPQWTGWLDRDGPGGAGDFETLADFLAAGQACPAPLAIECRTTAGGVDWTQTGEVYHCTTTLGGYCRNNEQPDAQCLNYEVRFLCPPEPPPVCLAAARR